MSRATRVAGIEPMLATSAAAAPEGEGWLFEPKYDGIRVLAFVDGRSVSLVTRNGINRAAQFPEIVEALRALDRKVVLDGEIVALVNGEIGRFQALQRRYHAISGIEQRRGVTPATFIAFDLLLVDDEVLLNEPLRARRTALEQFMRRIRGDALRIATSTSDGQSLIAEAEGAGWEGVMAKRADAPYRPGLRSRDWLKLKLEQRQEFVVGGYTEPRNTRSHLGALLVGYYDDAGDFIYAGHVGGGFSRASLADMGKRLRPLRRKTSAFAKPPRTNEPATWVEPQVIVEVRFNEWTDEGKLRQPIFLGVREDKAAHDVVREPAAGRRPQAAGTARSPRRPAAGGPRPGARANTLRVRERVAASKAKDERRKDTPDSIVDQLDAIEHALGGSGTLDFGDGTTLEVSNLGKVFFPTTKQTKGDILRHYTRMSDVILPAMRDRPLVLKRYPNGITGEAFYQQRAGEHVPEGIRVESLPGVDGARFIGGDLRTLLYICQLGAISVDPWHSRAGSIDEADYTIIDLDPGPKATFARVIEIAQVVKEELDKHGLHAVPKTSGASGIHIVLPLPSGLDDVAARVLAEFVATNVANRHKHGTIRRMTRDRPPGSIYVDFLQNIRGKTVAGVYSARAEKYASVSTPLRWDEVNEHLDPRDFTITNMPQRVADVGDLWRAAFEQGNRLTGLESSRTPKAPPSISRWRAPSRRRSRV